MGNAPVSGTGNSLRSWPLESAKRVSQAVIEAVSLPWSNSDRVQLTQKSAAVGSVPSQERLLAPPAAAERASANLILQMTDADGIMVRSRGDLQGGISGTVAVHHSAFLPQLQALEGKEFKSREQETTVKKISFDSDKREYVIDLKTWADTGIPVPSGDEFSIYLTEPPHIWVWDNYKIKLRTDARGRFEIALADNWMPDGRILDAISGRIREAMASIKDVQMRVERRDDHLYLVPEIKGVTIPLGAPENPRLDRIGVTEDNTKLSINAAGDLVLTLANVPFAGSSAASKPAAQPKVRADQDKAFLFVRLADYADKQRTVQIGGTVEGHLDARALAGISAEGEKLDHYLRAGDISMVNLAVAGRYVPGKGWSLRGEGDVNLNLDRGTWLVGAHVGGSIGDGVKHVDAGATDISILGRNRPPSGLPEVKYQRDGDLQALTFTDPTGPTAAKTSVTRNHLRLIQDGNNYFRDLMKQIRSARESIHLETFVLGGNGRPRALAEALALKAAGLQISDGGHKAYVEVDKGVPVRLLFDRPGGARPEDVDTYPPAKMLGEVKEQLKSQLRAAKGPYARLSQLQRQRALANLEANYGWHLLTDGVTRTDHRKVIVIDGRSGYTGGINLSENGLSDPKDRGKHDIMVQVIGPAVSDLQREFLENWEEAVGPLTDRQRQSLFKKPSRLQEAAEGAGGPLSQTQVLVTDDRQREIEGAMRAAIDGAKREIIIEHAYFTDDDLLRRLAAALRRGVNITVIIPRDNDEPKVEPANRSSIQQLSQAARGAQGKLQFFRYRGAPDVPRMNHTKAMTVDGRWAMAGSANMTQRSLHGAAPGFLYNRELVLAISDRAFTRKLNEMFQEDIKQSEAVTDDWVQGLPNEQKEIDKAEMLDFLY